MRRPSRPFSFLVAPLLICLFGAVGLRVGQIVRPSAADAASTWQSAAATSYSHARAGAYRLAWQQGYVHGWRAGGAAATRAGGQAGRAAGRVHASARALADRALAAVLTSSPRELKRGVKAEACVLVAGGVCEVLGPRVTGKPCPSDSTPYVEGGAVCLPRVLLLLARGAATRNP